MSDRRGEILFSIMSKYFSMGADNIPVEGIFEAMDEYMKEVCLSILEYVAKNTTTHYVAPDGVVEFKCNGEWITKEQLFESFL